MISELEFLEFEESSSETNRANYLVEDNSRNDLYKTHYMPKETQPKP